MDSSLLFISTVDSSLLWISIEDSSLLCISTVDSSLLWTHLYCGSLLRTHLYCGSLLWNHLDWTSTVGLSLVDSGSAFSSLSHCAVCIYCAMWIQAQHLLAESTCCVNIADVDLGSAYPCWDIWSLWISAQNPLAEWIYNLHLEDSINPSREQKEETHRLIVVHSIVLL